jgi:tyrosine phenol-lyase
VRLTIPRRVYTQAHMDVTAESVLEVFARRDRVVGLRFTYEPEYLRFFQARFSPVVGAGIFSSRSAPSLS